MDQKAAIADRLKQANNILVTVSNNPSVDQLASCIGLTLALNKLDKHATAVFSGNIPSTIEFLQPENTLEKNTDSLRDFIIALDKAKADKLRYKVEDKVVKIFITPYRTSINQKDLDFSQGDFNVDVVLALGVHSQQDLDQAITSHGRILHDAVVATINTKPGGDLGTMNWLDTNASSLSELVVELLDAIDNKLLDEQMSTALLTGIVAETERFSNDRTSPTTMTISAELMGAGANQQLVATKLQEPLKPVVPIVTIPSESPKEGEGDKNEPPKPDDGTLEIMHSDSEKRESKEAKDEGSKDANPPAPAPETSAEPDAAMPQIHIDDQGSLRNIEEQAAPFSTLTAVPGQADQADKGSTDPVGHMGSARMILQPPTLGGQLSSTGLPQDEDAEAPSGSPMSLPQPADPSFSPPASAATAPPPAPLPEPTPLPQPAPLPPQPVAASPMPTMLQPQPAQFAQPVVPQYAPVPAMPPAPLVLPQAPAPVLAPQPVAPVLPPAPVPAPPSPIVSPLPAAPAPISTPPSTQTLSEIEQDLGSPHAQAYVPPVPSLPPLPPIGPQEAVIAPQPELPQPPVPTAAEQAIEDHASGEGLASARQAVLDAINAAPAAAEPIQALNAQPLGAPLHDPLAAPQTVTAPDANGASFNPSIIEPTVPPAVPGSMSPPPPGPPPMMPPAQGF